MMCRQHYNVSKGLCLACAAPSEKDGGCATAFVGLVVVVVVIIAGYAIFSGLIGNFFTYHVMSSDHNDAVRTAVRNFVGNGDYVGVFEADATATADSSAPGIFPAKSDYASNVKLDPELGGYPGKTYTVNQNPQWVWFEFDNVSMQRHGHLLLTVYIQPTKQSPHTVNVQVNGYQDIKRDYTVHIPKGVDHGSVDIGIQGKDQYSYTVFFQGDAGTPFEAFVLERPAQTA